MPIELVCPNCAARLRVPDDSAGKQAKCPTCSSVVPIPATSEGQSPPAASASPFAASSPPDGSVGDVNPYASPSAAGDAPATGLHAAMVTPGVRMALSQTRPWVLFLGILGYIGAAFTGFAALVMLAMTLPRGDWAALVAALMYFVMTAIIVAMSHFLVQFARRIRDFLLRNEVRHLEAALFAQRSYWRLFGIIMAVLTGLYAIGLILIVVGIGFWSLAP